MAKFQKKPIVVDAVRQPSVFYVQTLEGTMRGKAGDWLVTGVKNEQWVVADYIFRILYDPVDDEAKKMIA